MPDKAKLSEQSTPTMEMFLEELFAGLEEAERKVSGKLVEALQDPGWSGRHLEDADPTWTGFINDMSIRIWCEKTKKGIENTVGFHALSRYDRSEDVVFSTADYRDVLIDQTRDNILIPALTRWFQQRLDAEKMGGLYDSFLKVAVWTIGYAAEGQYNDEGPYQDIGRLDGLKPDQNRRTQLRDYIAECVTSRNYDEWKTAGENPAHLEIMWLYDRVEPKDLRWYFERLYAVDGDNIPISMFYRSWEERTSQFVDDVIAKGTLTPSECQSFAAMLEVLRDLGKFEAYDRGMDFLRDQGFDPEAQQAAAAVPLREDVVEAIATRLPSYLREYVNGRRRGVEESSFKRDTDVDTFDWVAAKYVIHKMVFTLREHEIRLSGPGFDTEHGTSSEGTAVTFKAPLVGEHVLDDLTSEDKQDLFDALAEVVEEQMNSDEQLVFAPVVEVQLLFGVHDRSAWESVEYTKTLVSEHSEEWMASLRETYDEMLAGQATPYSSQLVHYLDVIWMYVLDRDLDRMLDFLETYFDKVRSAHMGSAVREYLSWTMRAEGRLLVHDKGIDKARKRFGEMTPTEHHLLSFAARSMIEANSDKHDVRLGHEFETIAAKTKVIGASVDPTPPPESEPARQSGWYTELFDSEDSVEDIVREHTDDNVLLAAGYYPDGREDFFTDGYDVRGWIACTILNESEAAYRTAIDFMSDVISDGFPARLRHIFSSDVDNGIAIIGPYSSEPLPIRQGNHFWANVAQYPDLHDAMRAYVKLSADKVVRLPGDEMEEDDSSFYRPDFYAAAALALMDPTGKDFAESLCLYADTIDMYYADDIINVIRTFLKNHGITRENVANLVSGVEHGFGESFEDYIDRGSPREVERGIFMEELARVGVSLEEDD